MYGTIKQTTSPREVILQQAADREERLKEFIKQNRPIRAIAELECLDHHYCGLLVAAVVKKFDMQYAPPKTLIAGKQPIEGLTDDSRMFRARLGDLLYKMEFTRNEVSRKTGIKAKAQVFARNRPFNYDWSISQIERLGRESNMTFREILLSCLLDSSELKDNRSCVTS